MNVGGQTWSKGMQTGSARFMCRNVEGKQICLLVIKHDPSARGTTRWKSDGSLSIAKGDTVIKGANHTYSDGNIMTAVTYHRSKDRVMHSYQYADHIKRGVWTDAGLWEYNVRKKKFNLKKSSHHGVLDTQATQTQSEVRTTQASNCNSSDRRCASNCCYTYYSYHFGYYGYYSAKGTQITGIFVDCFTEEFFSICGNCAYLIPLIGVPPYVIGAAEVLACVLLFCPGALIGYCGPYRQFCRGRLLHILLWVSHALGYPRSQRPLLGATSLVKVRMACLRRCKGGHVLALTGRELRPYKIHHEWAYELILHRQRRSTYNNFAVPGGRGSPTQGLRRFFVRSRSAAGEERQHYLKGSRNMQA